MFIIPYYVHQELRRRVVMAARRKTWLVLLDCEVAPHSLSHIQMAILSLPSTLTIPIVFCVVADVSGSAVKLQNAIVGKMIFNFISFPQDICHRPNENCISSSEN